MYVERITIDYIVPCLVSAERVRFQATIDRDASEIYPYLNAVLPGAIYNREGKTLTIRKEGRLITLRPREIAGGMIAGERDALELVDWLKGLINRCHENRAAITPSFERRQRLGALDIYKLLPGTNCRECGEPTCLAFAVKVGEEKAAAERCAPLFAGDQAEKRRLLFRTLRDAGYPVSAAFSD